MSPSTSLLSSVPRLRAHASVLLGSKPAGTACVWLVMELIDLEPDVLATDLPLDLRLVQLTHQAAEPLLVMLRTAPEPDDPLAGLATEERQVFVLKEVEGLDIEASAQVMGVEPAAAARALVRATRFLNEPTMEPMPAGCAIDEAFVDGAGPVLVGPPDDRLREFDGPARQRSRARRYLAAWSSM